MRLRLISKSDADQHSRWSPDVLVSLREKEQLTVLSGPGLELSYRGIRTWTSIFELESNIAENLLRQPPSPPPKPQKKSAFHVALKERYARGLPILAQRVPAD
jgi:hypothetical protein